MKIAFIYDVIYPYVKGGAEKRNWELARALARKGHEVHLLGMQSWEGAAHFLLDGVHLHGICPARSLYIHSGRRSIGQVFYFTSYLLPALLRLRFDVIDCSAFPYLPFFPVKLIASLRNTALVVTWQELWGDYWYVYLGRWKGWCARMVEKLAFRLAGTVVAHSGKVRSDLIAAGLDSGKVAVIPHGLDLDLINNTPACGEVSDLVFNGRLIEDKNVVLLLRSVAAIKEASAGIRCVIIGEGPQKKDLLDLSAVLGLEKNVVFLDFQPYARLIALLKSSKIFVFLSRREGFGIAVSEALACGLPVITARYPMNAAAELVKDGENGFISNPEPQDIALKILSLLRDGALREKLAATARKNAENCGWNDIAARYEKLYFRCLEEKAPSP